MLKNTRGLDHFFDSLESYNNLRNITGVDNPSQESSLDSSSLQEALYSIAQPLNCVPIEAVEYEDGQTNNIPWPWTASVISAPPRLDHFQPAPPTAKIASQAAQTPQPLVEKILETPPTLAVRTETKKTPPIQEKNTENIPPPQSSARQAEKKESEWERITRTVITHSGENPRISLAMKHLSGLYTHSLTFRETVAGLEGLNGISIEHNPKISQASYHANNKTVLINALQAKNANDLLAWLAYELTNAYHHLDFEAVGQRAAQLTSKEYAQQIEQIEYKTILRVQAYYREAKSFLRGMGFHSPRPWYFYKTWLGFGPSKSTFRNEAHCLAVQKKKGHTRPYEKAHQLFLQSQTPSAMHKP